MAAVGDFFVSSDDVGAPTLTTSAGSLISVLDWALDTGTATYWEKVYSGTNKAVYRSKTGLRPYLRVDDTIGEVAIPTMYETMTDVDTGTNPTPDPSISGQVEKLRWCKLDAGATPRWFVRGDSQAFFFYNRVSSAYPVNWRPALFGEVASYHSTDNYNGVLGGQWHDGTGGGYADGTTNMIDGGYVWLSTSTSTSYIDPGSSCLRYMRSVDGTKRSVGALQWNPFMSSQYVMYGFQRYDRCEHMLFSPYYILSSEENDAISPNDFGYPGGSTDAFIRGRIPWIYTANVCYNTGLSDEEVITAGSSTFKLFHTYFSTSTMASQSGIMFYIRTSDDEPDRPTV